MTNEVTIKLRVPKFAALADKAERELPGLIAATLQTQRALIFDSEGRYNGRPGWAPLKHRKGHILKDTGTLAKSIGPSNDGKNPGYAVGSIVRFARDVVTIGTTIAYAAVHDQGAVIEAHTAVVKRDKRTGKFVKASRKRGFRETSHEVPSYTIPARPFSNMTRADVAELVQTCETYVRHLLGGAT